MQTNCLHCPGWRKQGKEQFTFSPPVAVLLTTEIRVRTQWMITIMNRQLERIIRYTISSFVRSIYKFFKQQQQEPRDVTQLRCLGIRCMDDGDSLLLRLFHQCQPLCDVIKTGLTNWPEIVLFSIAFPHPISITIQLNRPLNWKSQCGLVGEFILRCQ